MPTIVKHYDKKSGKIRVYESTPHYDPVSKQSRPKRKYIGTLNPETGELIPSSGRRGRTSSNRKTTAVKSSADVAAMQKILREKEDEIASLKSQIIALESLVNSYKKVYASISAALEKVPGTL